VRETNFSGEAFVVEWEIFVGREPDWEGFRRWLNNLVDAGNIGRWGCEGFVGIYAMWEQELRHGCLPPSSWLPRSGHSIACTG